MSDVNIARTPNSDNSMTITVRCNEFLLVRADNEPLTDEDVRIFTHATDSIQEAVIEEDECTMCMGEGTVDCEDCPGDGECEDGTECECDGSGQVTCPDCDGE